MNEQESVNVEHSKKVDEQIKAICINYFKLMIECAENETTRQDFMTNPHRYMDRVGMKVPDTAKILLDSKNLRWPVVYVKSSEGKIAIAENKLAVDVIEQFPSERELVKSIHKREHIHLKEWGEVDVSVHEALQDCQVVVRLPFYDVHDDILTEVKFNEETEIILTVAC